MNPVQLSSQANFSGGHPIAEVVEFLVMLGKWLAWSERCELFLFCCAFQQVPGKGESGSSAVHHPIPNASQQSKSIHSK